MVCDFPRFGCTMGYPLGAEFTGHVLHATATVDGSHYPCPKNC
jgi:hypothetical protein